MNTRIARLVLPCALGLFFRWSTAIAATPDGGELLQAQLTAGEFAPAVAAARELPEGAARDARFAQIAQGQAQVGARSAALTSAGAMQDDRARAAALAEMATSLRQPPRALGGGQQADFASLIDLITTTIAPTTWDDVGGPGSVAEFRTGVYVDAEGVLNRNIRREQPGSQLDQMHRDMARQSEDRDARRASPLRMVSLTRLERAVHLLAAQGRRPSDEMQTLAGLERIQYIMVYPDTGDLVVAGPADRWEAGPEGRIVAAISRRPVVRLDDLIVVLRHLQSGRAPIFGCSITPSDENLQRTKAFLEQSSQKPLKPGQRDAWLAELRAKLGQQIIDVDGIDPRTRAAQILVEADYHMKLVGMGIEKGSAGVTSYLDSIQVPKGQAPPPLDVLRWWFTMNYDAVRASSDRQAFEIRGTGVQVLSENEMLSAQGKRVHTGASQPLNQAFAQSFTDHFAALAEKYPVHAELQNIFDLALVAAIVKKENLADQVNWHMTCFGDPDVYTVPLGPAPRTVETVINHRVVNKVHILAGVSGGVHADPWKFVATRAVKADDSGKLKTSRSSARPGTLPVERWWWD